MLDNAAHEKRKDGINAVDETRPNNCSTLTIEAGIVPNIIARVPYYS